ncbi:MAG TPA: flagellar hook-basal body complex protein [Solirubrobacteraceae bacterium]|nr:flagellar hook-basal body complex protein [Solirubrobacteraceae bacterium]
MNAAISGLEAAQTQLDTTANNLANVDTIGYKAQSIQFVDELSQTLQGATGPNSYNGGSNAKQVGLGVQVGAIENMMGTGSLQTTGNPLDVAINGNGFFQVDTGDPTKAPVAGTIQYSRAGNLTTNSAGFLTTQSGQYLVGVAATANGNGTYSPSATQSYIQIPTNATNVNIGQDGSVTYTDQTATDPTYGQTVTAGYLQLATFPNNAGLTRNGGSLWSASPSSGTPITGTPGTNGLGSTISGELESSNVDMATEFSNMITAQNDYQANSKVISTAALMLQSVVQMAQ